MQRTVIFGLDRQHAATICDLARIEARRLARRDEADMIVRLVTKRLVFRRAAQTQRRALAHALTRQQQLAAPGHAANLQHRDDTDGGHMQDNASDPPVTQAYRRNWSTDTHEVPRIAGCGAELRTTN